MRYVAAALVLLPLAAHAAPKYRVAIVPPDTACPSGMDDVLTINGNDNRMRVCVGDAPVVVQTLGSGASYFCSTGGALSECPPMNFGPRIEAP